MRSPLRTLRSVVACSAVVYVACFVLGPFVVVSVTGASCRDWSDRAVPALSASVDEALVAVEDRLVVDVPALPAGKHAAVLPGVTVLTADAGVESVLHEAAHHLQMERAGVLRYAWDYGADWVRGLYHGCGPYDAYTHIGYEIQARAFAEHHGWRLRAMVGNDLGGAEFIDALVELDDQGRLDALVATDDLRGLAVAVRAAFDAGHVDHLQHRTRPQYEVGPYGAMPWS